MALCFCSDRYAGLHDIGLRLKAAGDDGLTQAIRPHRAFVNVMIIIFNRSKSDLPSLGVCKRHAISAYDKLNPVQ